MDRIWPRILGPTSCGSCPEETPRIHLSKDLKQSCSKRCKNMHMPSCRESGRTRDSHRPQIILPVLHPDQHVASSVMIALLIGAATITGAGRNHRTPIPSNSRHRVGQTRISPYSNVEQIPSENNCEGPGSQKYYRESHSRVSHDQRKMMTRTSHVTRKINEMMNTDQAQRLDDQPET